MGLKLSFFHGLLCLLVLLPALCSSEDSLEWSRATYYGSPDCLGTPSGACGYGDYGQYVNGGDVAAVSRLYRNGTGCGVCYQIRCTIPKFCTEGGVKIVVTDYGEGDHTEFILSPGGFAKLARPYMASELKAYGVIGIEYKRIPCQYPGHNLVFKIQGHSRFPDYLAIVILFQGGQKDIIAFQICQEYSQQQWMGMRSSYGAVWDMENPPRGALSVRLLVADHGKLYWVELSKVMPSDWKVGAAYDSSIQFY